jgi:hypothetical protein
MILEAKLRKVLLVFSKLLDSLLLLAALCVGVNFLE